MGEAAPQYPESESTLEQTAPLGALVNFESQTQIWPDVALDLREKSIFGRKTIPITSESRLGSVVRSIVEAAPQLNFIERGQTAEEAANEAKVQTERLISKLRQPEDSSPPSSKVEHDDVIQKIWADFFVQTNHPAYQALQAIHKLNTSRREFNSRHPKPEVYADATLTDGDMFQLKESLVIIFGGDVVLDAFSPPVESED